MAQRTAVIGFMAVLALVSCSSGSDFEEPPITIGEEPATFAVSTVAGVDLQRIAEQYPRIDGSTSALPLQVFLACTIFEIPCSWQENWFIDSATRRMAPDPDYLDQPRLVELINTIQHSGTHGAYTSLILGLTDFILVARVPSEDELLEASERGVELDVQPIALDAFVFLVNAANPVEALPLETIRQIYTGEITVWSDLGGDKSDTAHDDIHTFQRNRNSGSQELMEKLVMRGENMIGSPEMILESMMGPINAIRDDPQGIGYSVYFYATHILPDEKVRLLGVDGVIPTSETIADGSYPLSTEVYAVIRKDLEPDHTAIQLRDWLLTPEGQESVVFSGYVPIGR